MKFKTIIWAVAIIIYAVFLGWHENWRGALTPAEQEFYLQRLENQDGLDKKSRAAMIEFMANDDGGEFFMVNLIQYPRGKVAHPKSGAAIAAPDLLQEYFQPFMGIILANAGYPAVAGPIIGGNVEVWGVGAKQWSGAGLIRYRSRRDLLNAATDPRFAGLHIYKRTALAATLAVPMAPAPAVLISPRVWLLFLLVALAALLHLFVGRFTNK